MSKALFHGHYTASQTGRVVRLTARGFHNTGTRYEVFFERGRTEEKDASFGFFQDDQNQRGNPNVLEPFEISTMFDAGTRIEKLVVRDAKGMHEVAVHQGHLMRRDAITPAYSMIA